MSIRHKTGFCQYPGVISARVTMYTKRGTIELNQIILLNQPQNFLTSQGTFKSMATWWRHQMETFLRYWPFVRGNHRSPVNSPHKGQWRGALIFSLICVWINGWVNNREAGDLRRYRAHYDVSVMVPQNLCQNRKYCSSITSSVFMNVCIPINYI